jgi:hypothetical protein
MLLKLRETQAHIGKFIFCEENRRLLSLIQQTMARLYNGSTWMYVYRVVQALSQQKQHIPNRQSRQQQGSQSSKQPPQRALQQLVSFFLVPFAFARRFRENSKYREPSMRRQTAPAYMTPKSTILDTLAEEWAICATSAVFVFNNLIAGLLGCYFTTIRGQVRP